MSKSTESIEAFNALMAQERTLLPSGECIKDYGRPQY